MLAAAMPVIQKSLWIYKDVKGIITNAGSLWVYKDAKGTITNAGYSQDNPTAL